MTDALQRLGVKGGAYIGVGPGQNFTYIAKIRPRIEFIVAISLSYLKKTGRRDLTSPVYWGIAASLLTSGVAGYFFLWPPISPCGKACSPSSPQY